MNTAKLFGALAKTVIATMVGGPIAGGPVAAREAVDLLVSWLGRERTPTLQSTMADVSRGLEQLASSERIDSNQLNQGMAKAEAIILSHGLSAAEIVAHDLNPERVIATVLSRSATELGDLDEPARELCRKAIRAVYTITLSNPEALPELQRAFQQATLTRLTELRDQPQEILVAISGALAAAAVTDHRRQWRPDLYPPSALLRAEFEIVPFYGREDTLTDLRAWADSENAIGVRLYTGAGGMGKTRLMLELCGQLGSDGWRAGFLNRSSGRAGWLLPLDALSEGDQPLLVVIDYAETRLPEVVALLQRALNRRAGGVVRIVLLARALGDWWINLKSKGEGVGDVLAGPATRVEPLQPLASDPAQRLPVFERAAAAFQRVVPGSQVPTSPSLEAKHYDRVLYVLVTALAAVQGDTVEKESDLLDWALRREREFLDDGIESACYGQLKGRPILQCAAVATLAGQASDRDEAVRLLSSSAPLLRGQPAAVVDTVAELLHRLYPGEAWLQGVLPDLLGEHLVERALNEDPDLLGAAFGHGH
jgi:hypothetical protein